MILWDEMIVQVFHALRTVLPLAHDDGIALVAELEEHCRPLPDETPDGIRFIARQLEKRLLVLLGNDEQVMLVVRRLGIRE